MTFMNNLSVLPALNRDLTSVPGSGLGMIKFVLPFNYRHLITAAGVCWSEAGRDKPNFEQVGSRCGGTKVWIGILHFDELFECLKFRRCAKFAKCECIDRNEF